MNRPLSEVDPVGCHACGAHWVTARSELSDCAYCGSGEVYWI